MASEETPKKPSKDRGSMSRARKNAELQAEHAEKMHRLAMLRRRIELASSGVRAYENGKIADAVKSFHSYLHILEDWKGVPEGKLMPSLFDKKTDVAELLLISGVYWDLTKLYDRTKAAQRQKDFHHYMEKYILFSKGMPFEHVCRETLRKYISNDKPVHVNEFKNAYKVVAGSNCFVATSLIDVCDERTLPSLRKFRDERLVRTRSGRVFVSWYYRNGPAMARLADRFPETVRWTLGKALDRFAQKLEQ
jgi:hypothetical protein